MNERKLTDKERTLIEKLGDSLYTPEFIEEWINRHDINVFTNAPAALQGMGADGYYRAVRRMVALAEIEAQANK